MTRDPYCSRCGHAAHEGVCGFPDPGGHGSEDCGEPCECPAPSPSIPVEELASNLRRVEYANGGRCPACTRFKGFALGDHAEDCALIRAAAALEALARHGGRHG